jgi:hypothetical protein
MTKNTTSVLAMAALAGTASAGLWSTQVITDLESQLQSDGSLVIATNAGAGAGATAVTVGGIDFGTDESMLSRITNHADTIWLDGSETPAVANLMGTGHRIAEWSPDEEISFGEMFVVGQQYRMQIIIGHAWDWAAVNLVGPDGQSFYNPDNDLNGVPQATLATYEWTATDTIQDFLMDVGDNQGRVNLLGFAVHAIPTPSAAALLGLGGLATLRRRR